MVGFMLSKYIQVNTVSRDCGSIFVRGGDFTDTGYQKIIGRIAKGMHFSDDSGSSPTYLPLATGQGVVILSQVNRIWNNECIGGGFPAPNYAGCLNRGYAVITKRVVMGNSGLRASDLGTPSGVNYQDDNSILPAQYLVNSTVRSAPFGVLDSAGNPPAGALLPLTSGTLTYVTEAFFTTPEVNIFPGYFTNNGYYSRNLF